MELENRKLFSDVLDEVLQIEKDAELETTSTQTLIEAVNTGKLLVPVVGAFSAGKSSLLNKFMGKNVLSVGINPETAIPSELYFSESEYCEGVTSDGMVTRLNDDSDITNYVCLRRYIKSEALKKLEPIVLVDMSGFDSSLDAHNKAIFNYLDKGSHYVVLTPVDAGTISASMKKQIQNILTFGRECSFFVSKTDLRSSDEVAAVKNEVQNEVSMLTGKAETVFEINKDDVSLFNNFAESLNANELFKKVFLETIKNECFDVKYSINIKISALKKDKKTNEQFIADLENALHKIEEKKMKIIEQEKNNNFASEASAIADMVGNEINVNLDFLVNRGVNSGGTAVQDAINEIVQSVVTSKINDVILTTSTRFSAEFADELSHVDAVFSKYDIPEFIEALQTSARNLFDLTGSSISNFLASQKQNAKTKHGRDIATTMATVFGITTEILAPWMELIIIALPTIIDAVFGKMQEIKQEQKIRSSIIAQIPPIKRELSKNIVSLLKENSSKMIESISEKYDAELAKKKEEIEQAQRELETNNEVTRKIKVLENCSVRIDTALERIIS